MAKTKLILKWSFVFSVLIIWTYFIITSITAGFAEKPNVIIYNTNPDNVEGKISEIKQYNVPFYSETSAGIEKASSSEILDLLFNYNFEIEKRTEEVPSERCQGCPKTIQ